MPSPRNHKVSITVTDHNMRNKPKRFYPFVCLRSTTLANIKPPNRALKLRTPRQLNGQFPATRYFNIAFRNCTRLERNFE